MTTSLFKEEHVAFEENVREFARRRLLPGYLERATSERFPWDQLNQLGEQGLLGLCLPEQAGGQGADEIAFGIACEQVAYADFNLAYLVFASFVAPDILAGLPTQVAEPVILDLIEGRGVVAVAVTEPRSGSDAARPTVRARPVAGGHMLSGEKTSVTLGAHANDAVVVATVDPALGSRGTKRLLVPLADETITRQSFVDAGFRPLGRVGLTFGETFVPTERELDGGRPRDPRSGIARQLEAFDLSRTLLGLMVIGAARRAIDMTVDWVRERSAFGRSIASFQGVSFPLAEHDTYLQACRCLCYEALALRAAGKPHRREAAMVKWWAPQVALAAINDCIVLHGHVGWSMEMPLQQLLLDVSGLQIGDGTPQIQKLVIARELIGREFVG